MRYSEKRHQGLKRSGTWCVLLCVLFCVISSKQKGREGYSPCTPLQTILHPLATTPKSGHRTRNSVRCLVEKVHLVMYTAPESQQSVTLLHLTLWMDGIGLMEQHLGFEQTVLSHQPCFRVGRLWHPRGPARKSISLTSTGIFTRLDGEDKG